MTDDERYERMVEIMVNSGPKLIDIGRGVVDAREIIAVLAIDEGDWFKVLESGKKIPFPAYAKSHVVTKYTSILVSEPADVIVTRWRQALGGLPEPIGADDARRDGQEEG